MGALEIGRRAPGGGVRRTKDHPLALLNQEGDSGGWCHLNQDGNQPYTYRRCLPGPDAGAKYDPRFGRIEFGGGTRGTGSLDRGESAIGTCRYGLGAAC